MATKTSFTRWIAGATLAVASLWNASAFAADPVPATLTQQGRILDKDGAPVSSKVHFVFTVYDDAEASKPADVLWSEEQDITLDDGYFSAELGSVKAIPADVFDGSVRYLGVTVGNDDEMAPRQSITSVPYALMAGVAASVPFTGISGLPACTDGYLKGFDEKGAAVCGAVPVMKCHTVEGTESSGTTTSAFARCPVGEFATGGGCETTVGLKSAYLETCSNPKACALCKIGSGICANDYVCAAMSASVITPSIRCCTVL